MNTRSRFGYKKAPKSCSLLDAFMSGGPLRIRTVDLKIMSHLLLTYSELTARILFCLCKKVVVWIDGLEPPTSCV